MEHSKKLMLVDPTLYRPSMREKTLSKLDEEIEQTLNGDLSDGEKANRYIAAVKKYRHYGDETVKHGEKTVKKETNWSSEVMQSVPVTQQYKAKRLLDSLKRNGGVQISDDGGVIFKQQPIDGSRITDLIGDVLQKNTLGERPSGWREFADSLKESKVPRELIVNQDSWRHMHPFVPAQAQEGVKRRQLVKRKELGGRDTASSPLIRKVRRSVKTKDWVEF